MGLSNKTKAALLGPLNKNNPVIVQVLGICSALAVTSKLEPSLVMAVAVTVVVALANVIISLLRKTIPNRIRIIVDDRITTIMLDNPIDRVHSYYRIHRGLMDISLKKVRNL